ncbi:hypothetical protein CTAYLR_007661 [Chrysophaeum taylorii]|uniref:Ubiquitinyl hydrolase 1 n=1 Tax=Chrysophaeum taylorii TaxID=2483200 RepID=A0AAD7U545_9STRA|nr:hypothetical protein CTAYLR_007661 [Chrysophaeum taylorii]
MGNICKMSASSTRSTSAVFEDPVTAQRTNALLNRWRAGEVTILQRLYRGARLSGGSKARGLDKQAFLDVFEELRQVEARLKKPVGQAVFNLFDSTGAGVVTFRDFCRALSWCCRGNRVERLRFLFCLFAIYEHLVAPSSSTSGNVGTTSNGSEQSSPMQHATAAQQQAQLLHEELALGDLDDEDEGSPKLGRVGMDALSDFCGVAPQEAEPLSFRKFIEWSDSKLPEPVVDRALGPLSVLSTPRSERRLVEEAWREANVAPGDAAFVVSKSWFDDWCRYVGVDHLAPNKTLEPPVLPSGGPQDQRPDEIDNSRLCADEDLLKPDARAGVDLVLVPDRVWDLVSLWYGGGPAIARTALSGNRVQLHPLSLRLSLCDGRGELLKTALAKRLVGRFDPDLPLAVLERRELLWRALFWKQLCLEEEEEEEEEDEDDDLAPEQNRQISALAAALFANDYDDEAETDAALRAVLSAPAVTTTTPVVPRETPKQQHHHHHQSFAGGGGGGGKKKKSFISLSSPLAAKKSGPSAAQQQQAAATNGEVELLGRRTAGEKVLARSSKGSVRLWVRRGRPAHSKKRGRKTTTKEQQQQHHQPAMLRWRLVSSAKFASLAEAGIEPQDELMVELADPSGNWPRAKLVEPQDFRDFKVGDRVDACDYRGKWFSGWIVAVSNANDEDGVRRVRVRFDRFAPKWDEAYDASSPSLAPPGTRVPPPARADESRQDLSQSTTNGSSPRLEGSKLAPPKTGGVSESSSDKANGKALTGPKQHAVPGATGLVNLGNTCFMNSALQCLSHTPLLRAYCLSESYTSEINRTNPLGYQGRMVEEFAAVLRQLWSEQYRCVAPHKFKRALARVKPQFAGNDQHDSQEFLAEMLDMLHEDVNRVVDKPYVVEPDDDEVDKLTSVVAGREAWDRYLLRNRSVIVDLFQGQLMSERRCTTCDKRSLKFETFMYLSVPLPAPRDRPIRVALVPKHRHSSLSLLVVESSKEAHKDAGPAPPTKKTWRSYLDGSSTTAAAAAASQPAAATVAAAACSRGGATPAAAAAAAREDDRGGGGGGGVVNAIKYAFELPRLGTVGDLKAALEKKSGVPARDLVLGDVFRHRVLKVWDDGEPLARVGDDDAVVAYEMGSSSSSSSCDEEDPVAEETWPESIDGLGLGARLDALDHRNQWYAGSVVAIDEKGHRRVRFDRFAPRWDEWYAREDWDKLAPAYSKSKRRARKLEIQVVHRRERTREPPPPPLPDEEEEEEEDDETDSSRSRTNGARRIAPAQGLELFGTPFVVRVDSDAPVAKLHRKVTAQALSYFHKRRAAAAAAETPVFSVRVAAQANLTAIRWQPPRRRVVGTRDHHHQARDDKPPDILSGGAKLLVGDVVPEGLVLALDWTDPQAYEDILETAVVDASCADLDDDDDDDDAGGGGGGGGGSDPRRRRRHDGVPLASCLDAFTKEELLADDNVWFCPKCKVNRRAVSRIEPWKLPDILVIHMKRFLASSQWREKINTRVEFPLTALDMSKWVSQEARNEIFHGGMLYDLFAVINHLGGLAQGHYTACVRAVPCSRDGVEEVASSFPAAHDDTTYRWLHVDDDIVEEVGPHQIVTEAAYVLFYRRRRLTPSTVINLSSFNAPSS